MRAQQSLTFYLDIFDSIQLLFLSQHRIRAVFWKKTEFPLKLHGLLRPTFRLASFLYVSRALAKTKPGYNNCEPNRTYEIF